MLFIVCPVRKVAFRVGKTLTNAGKTLADTPFLITEATKTPTETGILLKGVGKMKTETPKMILEA